MSKRKELVKIFRTQSRIVVGGPALHTILLSQAFNNNRYKTVLVGGANKPSEKSLLDVARRQNIKCYIVPEMAREIHFYDDIISFIRLYKLIKLEKPIIFHSHTSKAGAIGRLAAFFARVPIIFHTFHGHIFQGYFGGFKSYIFIWLERLLGRITDTIIVISENQKKEIVKQYSIVSENKTKIIPLGFRWKTFFRKTNKDDLRIKYNIMADKFLIGFIGRIVSIKNHMLFIDIAQNLILNDPSNFHFIVIGDGELRADFEKELKKRKIINYFTFTGWLNINYQVYQCINLVLLTSKNEGTPVALIEALAAGIPVLASAVGGVPDVLKKYNPRFIIKEQDPLKYANMIRHIRDKKIKVPPDVCQKIVNYYSAERLINEMTELYETKLKDFR